MGIGLIRLLQVVLAVLCFSQSTHARGHNLMVIVDMEPDDRVALMLLATEFPAEMGFVGTTGMHAGRKAALAEKFLQQMGLAAVPVIQGSGGEATSYPEIASSRAAREYQSEGRGLLPEADLAAINRHIPRSSRKLSREIQEFLGTWIHDARVRPVSDGSCNKSRILFRAYVKTA